MSRGQVGTFVLSQVKAASTAELYNGLILVPAGLTVVDENNFDKIVNAMPREWGRSVGSWDYAT